MDLKSIIDLPNEVIEKMLRIYLSSTDVFSFGITGAKRFKDLADAVLKKRSKLTNNTCISIIKLINCIKVY
jgi:hypothetical protein